MTCFQYNFNMKNTLEVNQKVACLPFPFSSPVNSETLSTLISGKPSEGGLEYTYKGAFIKSGDFVGEGLCGNSGANGQASFIDRANLLNIIKLITPSSPHSSYKPSDYPELQDVTGYKK